MAVRGIFVALVVTSLIGCSAKSSEQAPAAEQAQPAKVQLVAPGLTAADLKTPTREIVVTGGDINKEYDILGDVECVLSGNSVYSLGDAGGGLGAGGGAPSGALKELLQKVAYTKYGDRVDAVINAKSGSGIKGGFWGGVVAAYGARNAVMTAQGLAVSFHSKSQKGKAR